MKPNTKERISKILRHRISMAFVQISSCNSRIDLLKKIHKNNANELIRTQLKNPTSEFGQFSTELKGISIELDAQLAINKETCDLVMANSMLTQYLELAKKYWVDVKNIMPKNSWKSL